LILNLLFRYCVGVTLHFSFSIFSLYVYLYYCSFSLSLQIQGAVFCSSTAVFIVAEAVMAGPQNGDVAGGSSVPPPNIVAPEDLDAMVQILPTNQLPYGPECAIDRRIQAVFFHYSVSAPVVAKLDEEEFRKMTEFRLASPGLDSGMWEFVESFCPNTLQKHKLKLAVRRLLSDDPMCAISVKRSSSSSTGTKAKKVKVSSAPAAKVVSALLYEDISSSELSDAGEAEEKGDGDSEKKSSSNSCLSKSLSTVSSPVSFSTIFSSFSHSSFSHSFLVFSCVWACVRCGCRGVRGFVQKCSFILSFRMQVFLTFEVYFAGLLQLPCSAVADCSAKCCLILISVRFCMPGYGSGWGLPHNVVMNGFWMISLSLGHDIPS
jgi:hypothetical protein